jgi:insertion element IS1 protein InsB
VNQHYATISQTVAVKPKAKGKLTVQMGELWSFVDDKGNQQWVWLAMDAQSREIIGCHICDRSGDSDRALWQSLPGAIWSFIYEYNRLLKDKIMERGDQDALSILY